MPSPNYREHYRNNAIEVQQAAAVAYERIRADPSLSAAGRRQKTARIYRDLCHAVETLQAESTRRQDTHRVRLDREVFGHPTGTADPSQAISLRDATDRAAALTDPREALELLARAERNNDETLARAIAAHANDFGWTDLVDAWAAQRPDLLDKLTELRTLDAVGSVGIHAQLADGAAYYVPKPDAIADVPDYALDDFADGNLASS